MSVAFPVEQRKHDSFGRFASDGFVFITQYGGGRDSAAANLECNVSHSYFLQLVGLNQIR